MATLHSRLFSRIIFRNREVYLLKMLTLSIAFASSILIILFSLNEFSYDRFHNEPDALFRVLHRNIDEDYSGNRLSAKISSAAVDQLKSNYDDSMFIARVLIMKRISVSGIQTFHDQKIHAADPDLINVFTFNAIDGSLDQFKSSTEPVALLSARAARRYTGTTKARGKIIKLYALSDTIEIKIAAVFEDFPKNSHEDFDIFIPFDASTITRLDFDPDNSGVYGRALAGTPQQYESSLNKRISDTKSEYRIQPIRKIYFGPRVLGEDARHGDSYSVIILLCIDALILFLALTSFINLTTLSLPNRSKELAVKKLGGISQKALLYSFFKESTLLVGISLVVGLIILVLCSGYIEAILNLRVVPLILAGNLHLILIVGLLFFLLALAPIVMTLRFIRASPTRLLSTDTIGFPKFKKFITFLQLGISIFLIVASVVVRRQINYSLIKEPGRNHDQIVYLNSPSGITNEGVYALRSGWKKYNPNILDVMAVSQLPDRISSKEIGSQFYTLYVDAGFRDFFNFQMTQGNWFKVNDGDSIIVTNKKGMAIVGKDRSNVIGVIENLSGQFNQPERPVKIRLANDFNYNWLCVRVLEVDIRRTVRRLSNDFSIPGQKAHVNFLDKNFEDWLNYQDRLNVLSNILAVISALLSCLAIYGLSLSLVRDKLKEIAVHKLYGANIIRITRLLAKNFARQMLIAIVVFTPITYISLNELLRTFAYATTFHWMDPVYPIAYCAIIILILCGFQALSLNRADLTSALKG